MLKFCKYSGNQSIFDRQVNKWEELLLSVVVNESTDIQHRGCYIVRNMVHADKDIAEKVFAGQVGGTSGFCFLIIILRLCSVKLF